MGDDKHKHELEEQAEESQSQSESQTKGGQASRGQHESQDANLGAGNQDLGQQEDSNEVEDADFGTPSASAYEMEEE